MAVRVLLGCLLAGLGYLLWPLLWLYLGALLLQKQEADAGALLRAAPGVYRNGITKISGPPDKPDGRYLMRSQGEMFEYLVVFKHWTYVGQMGSVRFYRQQHHKLSTGCRKFSRFFDVCTVTSDLATSN